MLPVTKIQHFCTKDGPGIRTTVFFKGCPLRCVWCHNPETLSGAPPFFYADNLCVRCGNCAAVCRQGAHNIIGMEHILDRTSCEQCMKCVKGCPAGALEECVQWLSAETVLSEIMKDKVFYGETGGVTLSGGEPVIHADEVIPLLHLFQENHLHTAIETCGYFDPVILPELTATTNLFLWDIKDTDNGRHLANTGVSNHRIIDNLKYADALGATTILRCIMLKSVNLNLEHLQGLISIYNSLKHCMGVELIPYHIYGVSKNMQLGQNRVEHKEWIPPAEEIVQAEEFLMQHIPVIHN